MALETEGNSAVGGISGILRSVCSEKMNSAKQAVYSTTARLRQFVDSAINHAVPLRRDRLLINSLIINSPAQKMIDPHTSDFDSAYPFGIRDGAVSPNLRMKCILGVLDGELRFRHKNKDTGLDLGSQPAMSSTETDRTHILHFMEMVESFFAKSNLANFFIDRASVEMLGFMHELEEVENGDLSIAIADRRNGGVPKIQHDAKKLEKHLKLIGPVVDYLIPDSIPNAPNLRAYWTYVLSIYDHYSFIKDDLQYVPAVVLLDRIFDMAVGSRFWFDDKKEWMLTNIYGGDEHNVSMIDIVRKRFTGRELTVTEEFTDDGTIPEVHKRKGKYYTVKVEKWVAGDDPEEAKNQRQAVEGRINKYLALMRKMNISELLICDINRFILQPLILKAREFGMELVFKV